MTVSTVSNSWRKYARCKGLSLDLFYPEQKMFNKRKRQVLVEYCERCPVRLPCLEWALSEPEEYGIWAGFDIAERKRIMLRQRRARRRGESLDSAQFLVGESTRAKAQ